MKEIIMALVAFAVVGSVLVFGVRYSEQSKQSADTRPSIAEFSSADIPKSESASATDDASETASSADASTGESSKESTQERLSDPASIVVKVLNGGAAGGSAGKVAAYLKSNGYSKAESGNASGTNSGIVVYYASDMADEAKALQLVLLKNYKGVEAKPAGEAKAPEAKMAPMVVILGA